MIDTNSQIDVLELLFDVRLNNIDRDSRLTFDGVKLAHEVHYQIHANGDLYVFQLLINAFLDEIDGECRLPFLDIYGSVNYKVSDSKSIEGLWKISYHDTKYFIETCGIVATYRMYILSQVL